MKKILKQPCIWILAVDLLVLLYLVSAPSLFKALYFILPENVFFALEEFHLTYFLSGGWLEMLGSAIFLTAFVCGIVAFCERGTPFSRKLAAGLGYWLLGGLSMMLLTPPCGMGRETARRISCASNLKSIALVLQQYTIDYDDCFPPDLKTLATHDYLTDEYAYRCPSLRRELPDFSDYLYYGKGRKITEPPFLLLEDRDRNHPGNYHNRMFSDGTLSGDR